MTIHATKLHRPRPRASWIVRPRLLALLDHGLADAHRLILVSAPAGAGKTTLLAHWLGEGPTRAAWLSLDAEDDEPTRFWTCILHALQSVAPALGRNALEALTSPAPPPLASLLPDLLNEIGVQAEPLILILDDYHVLTIKAIHDSIATVVDRLPEQLRLVICTRADPPLPLARWRAGGELTEVRAAHLRFTAEEALAFLNQRMALNLQPEDAEQLVERTEGWAVGLQLAGLSLQGEADPRQAIRSFAGSRHYVLEYLLEEVLARQPETTQRFLLYTSVLNRLCGPLCDALTGARDSTATLLELQRQNLFVVPLDDEHFWFRYHHLFAELLRARLHQLAPDQVCALHLRASLWYEQNGAPVEAVQHAIAAKAWERAAHLLEVHEHDWWTGSDRSVMNLLPHLPDEVVLRGPNLSVYKAWFLLIRGQLQSASALLAAVAASIDSAQRSGEYRGLLSFVAMQQAYIAEIGGDPRTQELDAGSLSDIPESRGGMRNSAEVILAYVLYRDGNFVDAEHLLRATIERDLRTGATNGIPISASRLARMWIAAGRLQDAAGLCRRFMAIVEERGKWRYFVAGNPGIVLGDVLREWNRLDEAEACIRAGIRDNEPWQIAHAYALGYTALARLLLARGDAAGAAAALIRQEQLTNGRTIPPDLAAETRAVQMRLWLATGDMQPVARWTGEWAHIGAAAAGFRTEQDLLTLARGWLALDRPGEAGNLLARQQESAAQGGHARPLAEILLLAAIAWQAQGQEARALPALEQSLALAAPLDCLRIFLDERPETLAMVDAVSRRRNVSPEVAAFARKVISSAPQPSPLPLPSGAPRAGGGAHGQPLMVEALTAREQEVLALLSAGCSNRDIAEKLVITLHAVKKHTGNIYGKLGVSSRTQAIVRARELSLLS
jgi:LuxR family transcriptional regulator, maltose regulon positive regulatory protein